MDVNAKLKELEKVKTEGRNKVFTMYLNTDRADPDQQGGEWKIHLKNGMRNFESYLKEADDKEELNNFQHVKEKVERFIKENEQHQLKGIIVFATADDEVWYAEIVQMRLENEFYWQETPELDQFRKLKETYPKTGIILVQQNQIKIIDSYLNQIKDTISYELDVETDTWRIMQGPRKGTSGTTGLGSANLQKDKFDARYEVNQQRWYKEVASKIDKQAKDRDWKRIYVVGENGASNVLTDQMNKPVDEVIQKNMLDHEESKVMQEVLG
ncbi:VLRF1 family aeRF1-type release factor [Oceanobacillus sp. FSL K6-2867]|uniref:VLRF1 family aeRF1-type release factor n=1 Tax=Oceanobacillus sp. FSL K6-2867 TaxID=2954748 RepID=UPI0030D813DE